LIYVIQRLIIRFEWNFSKEFLDNSFVEELMWIIEIESNVGLDEELNEESDYETDWEHWSQASNHCLKRSVIQIERVGVVSA